MGIRTKISVGFLTLAILLFFSGMVSLIELNKLSRTTRDLLESASVNTALSKRMLDAVEVQNSSLLEMIVLESDQFDQAFLAAREEFENTLREATENAPERSELDAIYSAKGNYYELVTAYFDDDLKTDVEWFLGMYQHSYSHLTAAIKSYMMSSQEVILGKTELLEENAYRAITPGIITLCVAIIIVALFAFLLNHYYTRPIVRMNRSLGAYLRNKVPYKVTVEGKDEVHQLGDHIEELIASARNKK